MASRFKSVLVLLGLAMAIAGIFSNISAESWSFDGHTDHPASRSSLDRSSQPWPVIARLPEVDGEATPLLEAAPDAGGDIETLEDAWAAALATDPRLAAQERSRVAAGHSLAAAEAERLPSVSLDGSYQVRSAAPAFRFDAPGLPEAARFPFSQKEGFSAGAAVDVPLFTSGRIRHGIAAETARLHAASSAVERTEQELRLTVAEHFVAKAAII